MARDAPAYTIWPPVAIAAPLVLGDLLSRLVPLPLPIPVVPRNLLTIALILAFAGINVPAYSMMVSARTGILPGQPAQRILTTGPFRFTRNPLYVGLLALYVALALWLDSVWALALVIAAFVMLHYGAVMPEESYLDAKFGDEYRDYKARVPRWLL